MLHISCLLYRLLLRFYPADFRHDYGELMLMAFEDACHSAQADSTPGAWLRLWWRISRDFSISLYQEHRDNLMTQKIDHYQINATLGEGSAAILYRAYDPERSSQVALKVFKTDGEASLRSHFQREGQVYPTLRHPGIPVCYTYQESGENMYLVMQYIHGETLLERLQKRNRPFAVKQVRDWAMTICDILTYLHDEGYVYRDMKPGNLMLNQIGNLYLIDYGIIVMSEGDGVAIGTIGYAPPEQYKGVCTVQSDIYALGATLHHLLTNRDPRYHEAHSFHEALPGRYNQDVTPELEAIMLRALDPDPAARFETAEAMKQALAELA